MKLKMILLQALLMVAILTCGFVAGYTWPREVITEDDPGWDCRTMGNGVCGEEGERR